MKARKSKARPVRRGRAERPKHRGGTDVPGRAKPAVRRRVAPRAVAPHLGPYEVSAAEIANLDENQLRELMVRLCRFETALASGDSSRVVFAPEAKARDDGCDGATPANDGTSTWLPAGETCWQLKAGQAGLPGRLKGEVSKPIPAEYLRRGDHYVVVASACAGGGKRDLDSRLQRLRGDAKKAKLPIPNIRVLGAVAIAEWCSSRPGVGRWLLQRPGSTSIDEWTADPQHGIAYEPSPARQEQIGTLTAVLDPRAGTPAHVHVYGSPGVGKTRLAMEACREAPWRDAVAYFTEPGTDVKTLLSHLRAEASTRAVVVVDECTAEHVRSLSALSRLALGRIRLLTIGPESTEPLDGVRSLVVGTYSTDDIKAILLRWFPGMPREHVEFAAQLSDGYVRYARIVGEALRADPNTSVADIVGPQGLGRLLEKLLIGLEKRHLHVAAVLSSMGWSADLEDEGRTVATHLGLSWPDVKATLLEARNRYGIVRSGDRLCYLSPLPLAVSLALEAWAIHGDSLRTLPGVLPRDSAVKAFDERLAQLGGAPYAAQFFRAELGRYERLSDFGTERVARFWAALAAGEPKLAAVCLRRALENATPEERRAFDGSARREVMWALPRLVWETETFEDAMMALALLAAAETESWANNATGEFVSHFQLYLGGTTVPYLDRLPILDQLVERGMPFLPLVLASLGKAADVHESRSGGGEHHPSKAVGPEWKPTPQEAHSARIAAFAGLKRLIPTVPPELEQLVFETVRGCVWPLGRFGYADNLRDLIGVAVGRFPQLREKLRRELAHHITLPERAGKPSDTPPILRELHDGLVDESFQGRLLQHVGPHQWDRPADPEGFQAVVRALESNPGLIREHYDWLTSGEADAAFELGLALGERDTELRLISHIVRTPRGPDPRLPVGFLLAVSRRAGDRWLDDWLTTAVEEQDGALLLDVLSRSNPTEARAAIVMRLLRSARVGPKDLRALAYGPWVEGLPLEQFRAFLEELNLTSDGRRVALVLLAQRLKSRPGDMEHLGEEALAVIADVSVIREHGHEEWLWAQIAKLLVDRATPEIVRALCEIQLTDGVFLEHHRQAEEVLALCADRHVPEAWAVVSEYLDGPRWPRFVIGFPKAFVSLVPRELLLAWVAEGAPRRAVVLAHLISPSFADDQALESVLIEQYGKDEAVGSALYGALVSEVWVGPVSSRWKASAETMESVAARTRLPNLRAWSREVAHSFREMERQHATAEADEAIRWR